MFLGMLMIFLGNCGYQVHKDHQRSRYADMKKKEIEARGGGMWTMKDGKRVQVKD